jgi:hypothetical protein
MNEKLHGRKQACHIKNKTLTFSHRDGKNCKSSVRITEGLAKT